MTVRTYPLAARDILDFQPRKIHEKTFYFLRKNAEVAARAGEAYSFVAPSGKTVLIGGLLPTRCLWALVDEEAARPYIVSIVREVRRMLQGAGPGIYAEINERDAKAVRLAQALGFSKGVGGKWYAPVL
jgi:hypothetical protein